MKKTILTLLAATVVAGVAWADRAVDESRPLEPGGTVEIENVAGSVEVLGWDEDRVQVTGTLADTAERLEIEGSPRRLRIEVDEGGSRRRMDPTHLVVRMPRSASVEVETVSARIDVRELEGFAELESVSGAVTVEGAPSRLEVATVSGRIRVAAAPDGGDLESVSGDIDVGRIAGRIDAANVSGDIRIDGGRADAAELESVSGTIRCTFDEIAGPVDAETMSGTVELVVPADVSAEFELSTFSGSIRNAIGPEPQRTSRYTPGTELSFVAGEGGPRITLTSFSGSVRLETR